VAVGYGAAGFLSPLLGWRSAFVLLGVLSVILALAVRTLLPEPARGGASWIPPGATTILTAAQVAWRLPEAPHEHAIHEPHAQPDNERGEQLEEEPAEGEVGVEVEQAHIQTRPGMVLRTDPTRRSLWWAVRYVLSVRTNLVLIVASGLGYFYLGGLETFVLGYVRGRYHLPQVLALIALVGIGLGAIAGVLASGRGADALVHRGHIPARVVVAGVAYLVTVAGFLPATLLPANLALAGPLFFAGAIGLGGANAPLDAARLDIMHSRLWGRAESVRTAIRNALQAIGPVTFGAVADHLGAHGLDYTFTIMLAPLLVAGLVLIIRARATYPRDVATAVASEHHTHPS
jgi:predicted MFS family arabinose efflux permease